MNDDDSLGLRLDGKVAVVTGAAGGIASGIALRLARLGADLLLLDINEPGLEAVQNRVQETGRRVCVQRCDVSEPQAVARAAALLEREFGRCDVLVNNAGFLPPATSIEAQSVEVWDRSMEVNVRGVLLCTQAFGSLMLARQAGSIINIASIGAESPNASPAYTPAKAAVVAFTRHAAVEWGPRGVRVNSVSPGFVRSPLSEHMYANTNLAEVRAGMVPLRRLATSDDMASVVGFLACDAAGYVTGQDIQVDGGFLLTSLMHAQLQDQQYGGHGGATRRS